MNYSIYEKKRISDFFTTLNKTDGLRYVHFNLDTENSVRKMNNTELSKIDFRNLDNTFFTPNTFGWRRSKGETKSSIKRDYKHLDKLCALYVDLDLKNSNHPENYSDEYMSNIERVYYYIRTTLVYAGVLPSPTAYVNSGNGLHLYWSIDAVQAYANNNLSKWKAMQNYIYTVLKEFGADHVVSCDPVHIMRVPYTLNIKNDVVKNTAIYELTDNTYCLDSLIDTYNVTVEEYKPATQKRTTITQKKDKPVVKPKKRFSNVNVVPFLEKWAYVAEKRANDIEYLLLNFECKGRRETALFLYRYYMCQSTKDTALALDKTLDLNSRLRSPLQEREVVRATRSAQKYFENDGFNVTNAWIIEHLNITEEEQTHLCSILSTSEKARRKSNRDKARYEQSLKDQNKVTKEQQLLDRRLRVAELRDAGYTQQQIADVLGISIRTVKNDYKCINTEEFQVIYAEWRQQYEKQVQALHMQEGATFFTHKLYSYDGFTTPLFYYFSPPPVKSSA